jgi:hypothetical protein
MFEKLSRAAEKAASGAGSSRRDFLTWAGRAAAAVGALVALPGHAVAGGKDLCYCLYNAGEGGLLNLVSKSCKKCPPTSNGFPLVSCYCDP